MTLKFKDLKVGQAFVFYGKQGVYVRCHGGIRPGCGGALFKARNIEPRLAVELYNSYIA
jgi:hypothetical protein